MNVIEFWLDDNEIIWDAGLRCDDESIEQGESMLIKISIFLYVSSQDLYHTLDMVVKYVLMVVLTLLTLITNGSNH